MKELLEIFNMDELKVETRKRLLKKMGEIINYKYAANICEPIIEELTNILESKNNNTSEFILCSAIQYHGVIVSGRKHSDCYAVLNALTSFKLKTNEMPDRSNQGFLTSRNKYVTRKEAWKIALIANQIRYGLKASENDEESELISENLFGCD